MENSCHQQDSSSFWNSINNPRSESAMNKMIDLDDKAELGMPAHYQNLINALSNQTSK